MTIKKLCAWSVLIGFPTLLSGAVLYLIAWLFGPKAILYTFIGIGAFIGMFIGTIILTMIIEGFQRLWNWSRKVALEKETPTCSVQSVKDVER